MQLNSIDDICDKLRMPAAAAMVVPASSSDEWTIPQPQRLKYKQVFNQHDRAHKGFLTGLCSHYRFTILNPSETYDRV